MAVRPGNPHQPVAAESKPVLFQAGEPGGAGADGGGVGEQAGGLYLLGERRKPGSPTLVWFPNSVWELAPGNSVSRVRALQGGVSARGRETEFRRRAFPNGSLGTSY